MAIQAHELTHNPLAEGQPHRLPFFLSPMRYTILIALIALTAACQVNFNLFPKFEGKKKDKDNPAEISVNKDTWKALAGDPALYPSTASPATTPSPYTPPPTPTATTCQHNIVLYVRNKTGGLCTCQECWEVFACTLN
jgi:hypothetical protein